MKKLQSLSIVIPLISALLALSGYGKIFGYGVSLLCGIILCWIYGRNIKKEVWLIVAAFLFSVVGDWFLGNRKGIPVRFIYGIVFYFIAHAGYLWFSLKNGKIGKRLLLCILAPYLAFFFLMIFPNIDNQILSVAVLCYLLISCTSLAAVTGIRFSAFPKWLLVSGIACILFSDTIIAFKEFVGYNELNFIIMPTYYLSHILITVALVERRRG
jgi:uncharacterized membrane protein YhhN